MKSLLWISLLLRFLLFAQGFPVNEQDMEYQDGESDDEYGGKVEPLPVLRSKDRTFSVKAGDSLVLPCQVDNPENAVIIWWMGSNILYTSMLTTNLGKERSNIEFLRDNSLSISKILPADLGQYRCEVIDSNYRILKVHYFVGTTAEPQFTPAHPKNIVQKRPSSTPEPIDSEREDHVANPSSAASELRTSFALILSIIIITSDMIQPTLWPAHINMPY